MKRTFLYLAFCTFLFMTVLNASAADTVKQMRLPIVAPEKVGMDSTLLAHIDAAIENGIEQKMMPGCVVCIGRHGKIAFLKAYGERQLKIDGELESEPMDIDTVFDMASLTKPIATATSVMKLVEQGKIKLDAPVADYFEQFNTPEKKDITVRHLMTHTAGFIADNSINDYQDGVEKAHERLLNLKPIHPLGEKFVYSDVGFQLLGLLVEKVTGKDVNTFSRENIYGPLGMTETMYLPSEDLKQRAATTEKKDDVWRKGIVHDPRAFCTEGVAGHAGLFSTAQDIAVFSTMILNKGSFADTQILKPETVELMTTRNRIPGGYRALGWDMQSGYSRNRGQTMSPSAFGHSGFTGTSIWIDPEFDLFVIFFSNRVHPEGKGNIILLAGKVGTIAADAVMDHPANAGEIIEKVRKEADSYQKKYASGKVLPGIDVLVKDNFNFLKGKRVGVVSNHTGLTQDGILITKLLHEAKNVELTAIFSPEHGFTGHLDHSGIDDTTDETTGLTVHSLYGKVRRPTPEMLDNVDVLVFDIQDIGARFYTYTSTMCLAMEAAAEKGIPFVVLDRPNPIRGDTVLGSLNTPGTETFIAIHRMPVQHGMTLGELALLMNVERRLNLDLHVIPAVGWKRDMDFDAVKLNWVNPSPNMRNLTEAYIYPGLGLLEFTNISVGRGTDTPFEHFGAPWMTNPEKLVQTLTENAKQAKLQGVRFATTSFTPAFREFKDEECFGAKIILEDNKALDPLKLGMVVATTLRKLYPEQWQTKNLKTLLLHPQIEKMILDGKSVPEIESAWQNELDGFVRKQKGFLLYD